jgi:hypothetical protein
VEVVAMEKKEEGVVMHSKKMLVYLKLICAMNLPSQLLVGQQEKQQEKVEHWLVLSLLSKEEMEHWLVLFLLLRVEVEY